MQQVNGGYIVRPPSTHALLSRRFLSSRRFWTLSTRALLCALRYRANAVLEPFWAPSTFNLAHYLEKPRISPNQSIAITSKFLVKNCFIKLTTTRFTPQELVSFRVSDQACSGHSAGTLRADPDTENKSPAPWSGPDLRKNDELRG